jgi:fido (protein-threonine AMPylation protein)
MSEIRGLRLTTSAALKEQRLASLLAGRAEAVLREAVEQAQVAGSLDLAGQDRPREGLAERLLAATRAVDPAAPFTAAALLAWHRAAFGAGGYRSAERSRPEGPPPAPAALVAGRVAILEQWMNTDSARQLKPAEQGALVMARVMEILPFAEGNGLVARLAASHVMVGAGARPPVLVGADRPRLDEALRAAFRLETQPLATLLAEASERALDVMIAALQPPR